MTTDVLAVDPATPDPEAIRRAAAIIRAGGLVAFPTETVYGLGANALDGAAVGRIFAAKGRPATNPVIVHIASSDEATAVTAEWPESAVKLAGRFWPGPLTLVVPRRPEVPDAVTAGGPTIAVRCPAHPVAHALIRVAGVPIAAPSANRSAKLSPTRAEHVRHSLDGRIDLILDGGSCSGGLESTVVDVTNDRVRVLRPGLITMPMLMAVVGNVDGSRQELERPDGVERSPGRMEKHYSPRTKLRLVDGNDLLEDGLEAARAGLQVGSLSFLGRVSGGDELAGASERHVALPDDPTAAAARFYDALHRLDQSGLDLILVELPPDGSAWDAIRDRLVRAAGP